MKVAAPITALLLAGCMTAPAVITEKAGCSTLIADSLRDDVEGAPLGQAPAKPEAERNTETYTRWLEELAKVWQVFGVAQTGKLKQANEEKGAVIETQEDCEARDAAAIKAARPKVLGVF